MSIANQNLKLRLIQALEQFFELGFAITLLLGFKASHLAKWQVSQSARLWVGEQQVETRSKIEVGVKG
jgi:hypothetical protein